MADQEDGYDYFNDHDFDPKYFEAEVFEAGFWEGYHIALSNPETCTLIVCSKETGFFYQIYHDGEGWVGDRVDIIEEDGDDWIDIHLPPERIRLEQGVEPGKEG